MDLYLKSNLNNMIILIELNENLEKFYQDITLIVKTIAKRLKFNDSLKIFSFAKNV